MVARIFNVNSLRWMDLGQYLRNDKKDEPPSCNIKPACSEPPKPRNFLKLILLGILGSGFVGEGIWNYNTDKNQTEKIRGLDEELKKEKAELRSRVLKDWGVNLSFDS